MTVPLVFDYELPGYRVSGKLFPDLCKSSYIPHIYLFSQFHQLSYSNSDESKVSHQRLTDDRVMNILTLLRCTQQHSKQHYLISYLAGFSLSISSSLSNRVSKIKFIIGKIQMSLIYFLICNSEFIFEA